MVNNKENLQDFVSNRHLQQALDDGVDLTDHPAIVQIGSTLATIAAVVNPNMFVLGGPMTKYPQFIPAIIEQVKPQLFNKVSFIASNAPNYAPLNGVQAGTYELALSSFGLPSPPEAE